MPEGFQVQTLADDAHFSSFFIDGFAPRARVKENRGCRVTIPGGTPIDTDTPNPIHASTRKKYPNADPQPKTIPKRKKGIPPESTNDNRPAQTNRHHQTRLLKFTYSAYQAGNKQAGTSTETQPDLI